MNADCLKCARRGIFLVTVSPSRCAANNTRKVACACQRSGCDNGMSNPPGFGLIAVTVNDISDIAFICRVKEISRTFAGLLHPHVEWTI